MDTFSVAPIESGLNTLYPQWSAPGDPFYRLENLYPRRGRLSKRIGDRVLVNPSTAAETRAPAWAPGAITYSVNVATGVVTSTGPHELVVGQRVWLDQSGDGFGVFYIEAATSTTFTIFPLPAVYSRNGTAMVDGAVTVYLSIQGLVTFETSRGANQGELIAMTARQLLRLNPLNNTLVSVTYVNATSPQALNYDTLSGVNLDGELFVTNFRDSVYRLSVPGAPQAAWYAPLVEGGDFIQSCRKVAAYRGRLLFFNTYEGHQAISFDADFVTGNSIVVSVDGIALAAVPFDTDQATTMTNLVGAIKAAGLVANAAQTGARSLNVCPARGLGEGTAYPVTAISITGGVSQPTPTIGNLALTNYPYRVRFSVGGLALNDTTSFRSDLLNGSGFDDALTGEAIVSAEVQNDLLIVFFERSIWQLQYIGNPLDPFAWIRINNQFGAGSETGTWNYNDTLVTISQQGIVMTDGRSVERIDTPILDRTLSIESSVQTGTTARQASNFRRVHVLQDYNKQLLVWAYPLEQQSDTEPEKGTVRNNRVLYWNYLQNAWGEGTAFYTCFAQYRTNLTVLWEDLTEDWDTYTMPWESFGVLDEKFLIVAGHDSGRLLELNDDATTTVDQWGVEGPYGVDLITKFYSPYLEQGQAVRVPYIDVYGAATQNAFLTLNTYADDDLGVPVTTQTFSLQGAGGDVNTITRVYCNAYGRNLAFEILLSAVQLQDPASAAAKTVIQGLLVHAQPSGRFYQA